MSFNKIFSLFFVNRLRPAYYDCNLKVFIKKNLNIHPCNISLYKLAFRHRSRSLFVKHVMKISNERLEFLGDAMLNAIVADIIFKKFPLRSEGFLTEVRSRIVNRNALTQIALKMGIPEYVLYSKAFNMNPNKNFCLFGNVLEALIGAIYLDKGYKAVYRACTRLLNKYLDLDTLAHTETNYKSRLMEYCQKNNKDLEFVFKENTTGVKQYKFKVDILIDGQSLAKGQGCSKKQAECHALEKLPAKIDFLYFKEP